MNQLLHVQFWKQEEIEYKFQFTENTVNRISFFSLYKYYSIKSEHTRLHFVVHCSTESSIESNK